MPYIVMSDGCKIYYEQRGKGSQTLLFVHGLNSSHLKIKNFIDEFAARANFAIRNVSEIWEW